MQKYTDLHTSAQTYTQVHRLIDLAGACNIIISTRSFMAHVTCGSSTGNIVYTYIKLQKSNTQHKKTVANIEWSL